MDEDKDAASIASEEESSENPMKSTKNTESVSAEKIEESIPKDDNSFKVPSDIAFKKPIFIKPSTKINKIDIDEKPTEAEEQKTSAEEEEVKPFVKSPAQALVEKSVPLPYKEPTWSGLPKRDYCFEVLKNGLIVETISLNKPYIVIGRLAQCDIVMEHPSLSRFHCVIQYKAEGSEDQPEGFYAYDLESTHGSFHNKHRMKPKIYCRLHVGHMIKLGGSSRTLILQGPDEDQEPESKLTVSELKAEAAKRAEKLHRLETGEMEEEDRDRKKTEDSSDNKGNEENEGIDWGMGEDAVEEEDEEGEGGENPFAVLNEDLYLNDPKKTLRGWFEREGYEFPEYVAEDVSPGVYKCKVELPIPGPGGGPLVAIAEHRGRKKAVVIQCALEACRLLDRRGLLRQAQHESHEKKRKDWAKNDYYDSDEDDFLDRTGDVQRKRLRRMKTVGGKEDVADTYESLITKYNELIDELSSLEDKLLEADRVKEGSKGTKGDEDDLDSFMRNLKSQVPDKHKRVNWKLRSIELRKEEMRLRRLANIAKPFNKAELHPYSSKYDMKQKPTTKSPFQTSPDKLKAPKAHGLRVHKAFTEEEPEEKIKLRRLDEEGYEIKPVKYSVPKPKSKPKTPSVPEREKKESISITSSDDLKTTKETSDLNREERLSKPSSSNNSNSDSTIQSEVIGIQEKNETISDTTTSEEKAEVISPEKKPRLLGPTLPPHLEYLKAVQQEPLREKKKAVKKSSEYADDTANYETWVPPSNQTGDGRTSLNDKYGY